MCNLHESNSLPPHTILLINTKPYLKAGASTAALTHLGRDLALLVVCVCVYVYVYVHTKISCVFKRLYMSMCNIHERSSLPLCLSPCVSLSLCLSLSLCPPPSTHYSTAYCHMYLKAGASTAALTHLGRDLALLVVCVYVYVHACVCARVCVHILCQCSECAGIYNVHVYMHTFVYVCNSMD